MKEYHLLQKKNIFIYKKKYTNEIDVAKHNSNSVAGSRVHVANPIDVG